MIKYRLANNEDNQGLLELTASSGMQGETSLLIDRKPDFFGLLNMRGESKVFVALDGNSIIGSLCVSFQQVYVDGKIFSIQYVGDFKVAASYRNKGIGLQLCDELANYVISIDADLAFLNVSKGNTKPFSFFKNRPNIPDFDNIGVFKIHQFIGKRKNVPHKDYKIESADVNDEFIVFLNSCYCKYELGSVITKEKLQGTDCFLIRQKNNIVAAMCLIDTMNVKQNIATKISWKMRSLLKLINILKPILGISQMPLLNEPVKMMYIKYLAINKLEKKVVKFLINHARQIAYQKSYSFVSIGLHENDPLNKCFSRMLKITFNSIGMLVSIKDNRALIEKVKHGIPFEDYSLV